VYRTVEKSKAKILCLDVSVINLKLKDEDCYRSTHLVTCCSLRPVISVYKELSAYVLDSVSILGMGWNFLFSPFRPGRLL